MECFRLINSKTVIRYLHIFLRRNLHSHECLLPANGCLYTYKYPPPINISFPWFVLVDSMFTNLSS